MNYDNIGECSSRCSLYKWKHSDLLTNLKFAVKGNALIMPFKVP